MELTTEEKQTLSLAAKQKLMDCEREICEYLNSGDLQVLSCNAREILARSAVAAEMPVEVIIHLEW